MHCYKRRQTTRVIAIITFDTAPCVAPDTGTDIRGCDGIFTQ